MRNAQSCFRSYESSCLYELVFGFSMLYLFFRLNSCLFREPVYERTYCGKLLTGNWIEVVSSYITNFSWNIGSNNSTLAFNRYELRLYVRNKFCPGTVFNR